MLSASLFSQSRNTLMLNWSSLRAQSMPSTKWYLAFVKSDHRRLLRLTDLWTWAKTSDQEVTSNLSRSCPPFYAFAQLGPSRMSQPWLSIVLATLSDVVPRHVTILALKKAITLREHVSRALLEQFFLMMLQFAQFGLIRTRTTAQEHLYAPIASWQLRANQ